MTNSGLITDLSSCHNIGSVPLACDDEDEILSPESSGVEASSESLVITTEGNSEVESHHVPEIGMKFSSEEEALKFYKKYAMERGFKVRKGKVQRLADKSLVKRYFYCSKEGFRSKKQPTNTKKFTRKETRTGCKAMIQISFKNEECSISHFISEHNHDLQGLTQWYYIDSCSKIPEADPLIQPTCEIEVAKEAEAVAHARFFDMSYSKHLRATKSNILQPEDAQGLIDYLKKLQVEDLSLFYTFQVDAECHMTNFFWRDSRSKIDYYYFGDVLILDTTFKTDRYNMICAPFLGLNHHRRHVLFGCAFLLDESVESFTWLLGTFMEAMGRRQPKTIFTTDCLAISEAVEVTLPKSQHLLCKQLVCQNAKQHLSMYYGHPGFERDFYCCLFDYQSEGEFQSSWSSLLEQYNLHENPWLQNIHTLRSKWSYLFCKMTFCAGINSNQGLEYNANVFQNAKSEAMMLWEYVLKYEKAVEHQRREELHEDFGCTASEPELSLSSPMKKQAASVYTPTMFNIFRSELIQSMSVPLKRMAKTGSIVTYKTKGENTESSIEFNSQDSTITCSCKKFESEGILCAHALKVLNIRNIFHIPPQYILKRWTKSAKDGVVEGEYNGEEIADNSESLCKSKFMHKAVNFITKSVAVKKTRQIAERYLDIALKEVDDELKKGNEHHNTKDAEVNHEGVKNTSSVARVDWQEKVAKDLYLNPGETSKGTMEFQIQKKRKNEVREKMNSPSSSMSLP